MFNIRCVIRRFANAPMGESFSPLKAMINYIKTFVLQNFRANLNDPSIPEKIVEFLQSKNFIPEDYATLPPAIVTAIQQALQEIKSDPSFVQPKMQRVRLVLPQEMRKWLDQHQGSDLRPPDEFLGPINAATWSKVVAERQLKQRMKEWLREYGNSGKVPVPVEFTGNPETASLFEEAKQEIAQGLPDQPNSWESVTEGVSSDQLAQAFINAFPEYIDQIMREYGDSANPLDLIKDYAFRAETGGKSKVKIDQGRTRTFQDQRLNFFWENREFIPDHIRETMPLREKDAFVYMSENADELTNALLELIAQREPKVLEYVQRKLRDKTRIGPGGQKGVYGPAQFGVDNEGQTMDVEDKRQQQPGMGFESHESRHDANLQMLTAVSNSFKQVAKQMRGLARDVVWYLKEHPKEGRKPTGELKNPRQGSPSSPDMADYIEGYVGSAMNQLESALDPSNPNAEKNIKNMGLKIDPNTFEVDVNAINWGKLVPMLNNVSIANKVSQTAKEHGRESSIGSFPTLNDVMASPTWLLTDKIKRSVKGGKVTEPLAQRWPALFANTEQGVVSRSQLSTPEYAKQLENFYQTEANQFRDRVRNYGKFAISYFPDIGHLASIGRYPKEIVKGIIDLLLPYTGITNPNVSSQSPWSKYYRGIQQGDYSLVDKSKWEGYDFPNIEAYARYTMIKTAIAEICDLATLRNRIGMVKTASKSMLDSSIENLQQVIVAQCDALLNA